MNYYITYNLNKKRKDRRLKQKEIILTILFFAGLIIASGLAGKVDLLYVTRFGI